MHMTRKLHQSKNPVHVQNPPHKLDIPQGISLTRLRSREEEFAFVTFRATVTDQRSQTVFSEHQMGD